MKKEYTEENFKNEMLKVLLEGICEPNIDSEWTYFKTQNTRKKKFRLLFLIIPVLLSIIYVVSLQFKSNSSLNNQISFKHKPSINPKDELKINHSKKLLPRCATSSKNENLILNRDIQIIDRDIYENDSISKLELINVKPFAYMFEYLNEIIPFKKKQNENIKSKNYLMEVRFNTTLLGLSKFSFPQTDFGIIVKKKIKKNTLLLGFNYNQFPLNKTQNTSVLRFNDSTRFTYNMDSITTKSIGLSELVVPIGYIFSPFKHVEIEMQYRFSLLTRIENRLERFTGSGSLISPSSLDSVNLVSQVNSKTRIPNISGSISVLYKRERFCVGISYLRTFNSQYLPMNRFKFMIGINIFSSGKKIQSQKTRF